MKTHLSISEIAQITSKERSTVLRWIKAGKFGQVRKVGNTYQVPHANFEQWWVDNVTLVEAAERKV